MDMNQMWIYTLTNPDLHDIMECGLGVILCTKI